MNLAWLVPLSIVVVLAFAALAWVSRDDDDYDD